MSNRRSHIDQSRSLFSRLTGTGLALLLAGTSLWLSACTGADGASDQEQSEHAATMNEGIQVETVVLEPAQFSDVIEVSGSVKAVDDATLSAQSAGTVVALAELGQYVERAPRIPCSAARI